MGDKWAVGEEREGPDEATGMTSEKTPSKRYLWPSRHFWLLERLTFLQGYQRGRSPPSCHRAGPHCSPPAPWVSVSLALASPRQPPPTLVWMNLVLGWTDRQLGAHGAGPKSASTHAARPGHRRLCPSFLPRTPAAHLSPPLQGWASVLAQRSPSQATTANRHSTCPMPVHPVPPPHPLWPHQAWRSTAFIPKPAAPAKVPAAAQVSGPCRQRGQQP